MQWVYSLRNVGYYVGYYIPGLKYADIDCMLLQAINNSNIIINNSTMVCVICNILHCLTWNSEAIIYIYMRPQVPCQVMQHYTIIDYNNTIINSL